MKYTPAKDNEEDHDARPNGQGCICAGGKGAYCQAQGCGCEAFQREDSAESGKSAAPAAFSCPPSSSLVLKTLDKVVWTDWPCVGSNTAPVFTADWRARRSLSTAQQDRTWRVLGAGRQKGRRWKQTGAGTRRQWATQQPAWRRSRAQLHNCSWTALSAQWCAPWGRHSGTSPGCSWPH